MSVPSLYTMAFLPAGTVTPVNPVTLIVTVYKLSLKSMYGFWTAGTNTVEFADTAAEGTLITYARAFCNAGVLVSVNVAVLDVKSPEVSVAIPTIACSTAVPKLVLVVAPQAPFWSPVPINSIFKLVLYVLAMICP